MPSGLIRSHDRCHDTGVADALLDRTTQAMRRDKLRQALASEGLRQYIARWCRVQRTDRRDLGPRHCRRVDHSPATPIPTSTSIRSVLRISQRPYSCVLNRLQVVDGSLFEAESGHAGNHLFSTEIVRLNQLFPVSPSLRIFSCPGSTKARMDPRCGRWAAALPGRASWVSCEPKLLNQIGGLSATGRP